MARKGWGGWALGAILLAVCCAMPGLGADKAPLPAATPTIQMAILLDTSNSMDGLINQARTQLWSIVQEFTVLKLAGKQPRLELALFEYGNNGLPAQEGFIRLVVPFTTDLDKVSEAMWSLRTNGGDEFCGQVIDRATHGLTWSKSSKDVKCIFIAGNEPFTQGTFDYAKACKAAADRGITVNTIFCGSAEEGARTKWEDGAKLADGKYLSINQDQAVVHINAPQDAEIAKLGAALNKTYLAYGSVRRQEEALGRQVAQDANAAKAAPAVAAARAGVKASGLYRNADWDLVDAVQEKKVKLEDLPAEQLPEALRGKSPAEQKQIVADQAQQRKQIQTQIKQLNDARNTYVAAKQKEMEAQNAGKPSAAATFSKAVVEGVARQANRGN